MSKVYRSELNPVDFLSRAAYLYPEKPAVVDGGRRYSYRELAQRSWRLANALRSAGLRKGDRVGTLLFNSAPMLEAHFGVPAAGGVLVAINNRLASAGRLHPAAQRRAVPAAGRRARGAGRAGGPGRSDRDPLRGHSRGRSGGSV
jgi:acyl-CoA synthetase (AMP-forming)/AMP-acid ligase II